MLPPFFLTFFKIHDIIKEKGIKYEKNIYCTNFNYYNFFINWL